MTNLFIELYLVECVDVLVANILRARGFTATTTHESGQLHNSDIEQLDYAISQRKAFLTHNLADFEALHRASLASGKTHYGIKYF